MKYISISIFLFLISIIVNPAKAAAFQYEEESQEIVWEYIEDVIP